MKNPTTIHIDRLESRVRQLEQVLRHEVSRSRRHLAASTIAALENSELPSTLPEPREPMMLGVDHAGPKGDETVVVIRNPSPAMMAAIRSAEGQPEPQPPEAQDLSPPGIKEGPYNYYGPLWVKSEGGVGYWSIENYDGQEWLVCPPAVFQALVEEFVK